MAGRLASGGPVKKFEVGIYNKVVRELVAKGERHRDLNDSWADMHYLEITARDEGDARTKIEARHPSEKGFVITSISLA
jgi:hypothetical protein